MSEPTFTPEQIEYLRNTLDASAFAALHAATRPAGELARIHESREELNSPYRPINWNRVPEFDKTIWDTLVQQFWVDTRIPLSDDLKSWGTLKPEEQTLVLRVFAGLTALDTIQARFGADSLKRDAESLFEEAIYSNIAFMENIHAKSYSSIFSTLSNTQDIDQVFRWAEENEYLRTKIDTVMAFYQADTVELMDKLKKKIVSVYLESFLFYSGFYLPIWLNGQAKLTNTGDMIRLIMRDEAVHGQAIGAWFKNGYRTLTSEQQSEIEEWAYDVLQVAYDNEVRYTQDLYDGIGLTEEVKAFLRYNANRALANLGFDPLFPKENLNPVILNGMDLTQENVDFFSGTANYVVASKEEKPLDDEDWDF